MKPKLPEEVMRAVEQAKRTAGWNNRHVEVQRFELPNVYGHKPCLLYVVPARCWAYRCWDRRTNARQDCKGGIA